MFQHVRTINQQHKIINSFNLQTVTTYTKSHVFQYSIQNLSLLFVSPILPDILKIVEYENIIFVISTDLCIRKIERGRITIEKKLFENFNEIIPSFEDWTEKEVHFKTNITLTVCNSIIVISYMKKIYLFSFLLEKLNSYELSSCILCSFHPLSYKNKIIIYDENQKIILFNINKKKIIHQFHCLENEFNNYSNIENINNNIHFSQSSNPHSVLLYSHNIIFLINLQTDEILLRFESPNITSISISPSNTHIICTTITNELLIYNTYYKKNTHLFSVYNDGIFLPTEEDILLVTDNSCLKTLKLNKSKFEAIIERPRCLKNVVGINYIDGGVVIASKQGILYYSLIKEEQSYFAKIKIKLDVNEDNSNLKYYNRMEFTDLAPLIFNSFSTTGFIVLNSYIYKLSSKKLSYFLYEPSLSSINISKCSNFIIIGTYKGSIYILTIKSKSIMSEFSTTNSPIKYVSMCIVTDRIILCYKNILEIRNISGELIYTKDFSCIINITSNYSFIAIGNCNGIDILCYKTGKLCRSLQIKNIKSIEFSNLNNYIAVMTGKFNIECCKVSKFTEADHDFVSSHNNIFILDILSGKVLQKIFLNNEVEYLKWSSDDAFIIIKYKDNDEIFIYFDNEIFDIDHNLNYSEINVENQICVENENKFDYMQELCLKTLSYLEYERNDLFTTE
ncbi:hypothetical protein LUQ84_001723 [Hamiltosporidium tvaerminnensis]|nr:hypothetical protein LUQ84_001723 [Hamiltosporidium tvaerminnensis]